MRSCGAPSFNSCRAWAAQEAHDGSRPAALKLAATNCAIDASSSTIRTAALSMRLGFLGGRHRRQVEAELGARLARARLDAPAVGFHDRAANRQPQPGAAALGAAGALPVTVEETGHVAGGQARAMIANGNEDAVAAAPSLHQDVRLGARVTHGVVHEIGD